MRIRASKRTLGVAASVLAIAGVGSAITTGNAYAARISFRQVAGATRYLYLAATGEINRMSVTSSAVCPGCEQAEFVFRGAPRPIVRGCRISAVAVTCTTGADEQVEGLRVYLGDRGDTATANGPTPGSGAPDITLYGMAGNDRLKGRAVVGGLNNDTIFGTPFADRLDGGLGNDHIDSAGGGVDTVICGPGIDVVRGDRADRLIRCERVIRV